MEWCSTVADLSPLNTLTCLTHLDIKHCSSVGDHTPLTVLTSLGRILVYGTQATVPPSLAAVASHGNYTSVF